MGRPYEWSVTAEVLVTACRACLDELRERHRPVAPLRVHLQVTSIVGRRRASQCRIGQDPPNGCAAQEVRPKRAALGDIGALACRVDCLLDYRRVASLEHFGDDASRRGTDAVNGCCQAAARPERGERLVEPEDGRRRTLVAKLFLTRRLDGRQIAQEKRYDGVDVLERRVFGALPSR